MFLMFLTYSRVKTIRILCRVYTLCSQRRLTRTKKIQPTNIQTHSHIYIYVYIEIALFSENGIVCKSDSNIYISNGVYQSISSAFEHCVRNEANGKLTHKNIDALIKVVFLAFE